MTKTYKKLSVNKGSTDFKKAISAVDVPLEPPKDDQILIKNIYAGVNANDVGIIANDSDRKVPFNIGIESMGVVEAIGKNVTKFTKGQSVLFGSATDFRAYSEYIYAKPEEMVPIPEIKPEFFGAAVCGLTASIGLDKAGRLKQGEKVLITAAAGGVGHIAVQWAKRRGAHVIGVTTSEEKARMLKHLKCDRVIHYKREDLDKVLTKEYSDGIDVIWDTIGGKVCETLFKHLGLKGRMVVVGFKDNCPVNLHNFSAMLINRGLSIQGFLLLQHEDLFHEYLKELTEDIIGNKLRVVADTGQKATGGLFNGIESVVRGIEHLQSGKNIGKVVVKLQDI